MPYNSGTGAYERRSTTVIDATPDGDTVAVAIDVKLDQGIDDYVTDLNHHNENGNHYPATSVWSDSRFLKQSPAGVVSWADGVVAADAALKDFSNVASGAIVANKLASGILPSQISGVAYVKTNLVGTVSESSGVPTGAVIERGSSANGYYVRYADGTQICALFTHTIAAVPTGTTNAVWTLPSAFYVTPSCTATLKTTEPTRYNVSAIPEADLRYIRVYLSDNAVGSSFSIAISLIAVGRWF